MDVMSFLLDLRHAAPESIMAIMGVVGVLCVAIMGERSTWLINSGAALVLILSLVSLFFIDKGTAFFDAHLSSKLTFFFKSLIYASALCCLQFCQSSQKPDNFLRPELPILIIFAVLGMSVMVSAQNMLGLYLGLELASLSLYICVIINRSSSRASEAALKYFVLSALSSGIFLYGVSLIYAFTGSFDFLQIAKVSEESAGNVGLLAGMVLILVGISFKLSAVPFHMWTPDVFQGSPTPITALFATSSKVAALGVLINILFLVFPNLVSDWVNIISLLAIASMILGAFTAINQDSIKRLLAYSSIGHIGYILIGMLGPQNSGLFDVLFYMFVYVINTVGIFAFISGARNQDGYFLKISDFAGLSKVSPLTSAALTILFFSLAGIPFFAGFFAKLSIFLVAVKSGMYFLTLIAVLSSVVSAFYYLRIIKIMYFDDSKNKLKSFNRLSGVIFSFCVCFVLFYILFAKYIDSYINIFLR